MEHYILEGVIALCFWLFETSTIEYAVENFAGVTPRGVVYTLRSVLRFRENISKLLIISVYLFRCLCTSNKVATTFLLMLLLIDYVSSGSYRLL